MNNSYILYNIRLQWHTSSGGCDSLQVRPRGATPRPRSGADVRRTLCPRGSSQKELPHRPRSGQWPRVPGCDSSEAPGRSYPRSKKRWLPGHRRAERSYSTFKDRRGGSEETPLVQGKRNPSKTVGVARGHMRPDTLKPYSQKTSQSNHTRTTALSNSMKLSHALWGHPRQGGHGGEI